MICTVAVVSWAPDFDCSFLAFQLLMCGTGDISVCDFKAHAVVVGGSWHFREKASERIFPSCLLKTVIPTTLEDNLNCEQISWLEIRLPEGRTGIFGGQE